MQLRYSVTSPYVRKALVVARESGIVDRIEITPVMVLPTLLNDKLKPENPLVKIPTLVTDEGETLYDSRVVCEYLDAVGGKGLFPAVGPARWTALRRQALADGILDAAILVRFEMWLRPEERRWDLWVDGQMRKVRGGLDALEHEAEALSAEPLTIGQIAIGCALGYIDFRYDSERWRDSRPKLAAWYETFAQRPSMLETEHRNP
jgi:glutathione S-transferase